MVLDQVVIQTKIHKLKCFVEGTTSLKKMTIHVHEKVTYRMCRAKEKLRFL